MASFRDSERARERRAGERPRAVAPACALDLYLERRFLPLEPGVIALADWSAENRDWLERRYTEAEFVLLTNSDLNARIVERFGAQLSDDAILALDRRTPLLSARRVVSAGQARALLGTGIAFLALACARPSWLVTVLVVLMSALFLLGVFFRALLAFLGAGPREAAQAAADGDLPVYTILVPLYREAAMIPTLTRALLTLDYPGMLAQLPQVIQRAVA